MKNYKSILVLFIIQTTYPFTYFRSVETLNSIKEIILNKEKGALLRFGDGDLALAHGGRSGTHDYSDQLKNEMIETFGMNDRYLLKTLPLICHEHGGPEVELFYVGRQLSKKNCREVVAKAQKIWGEKINYIYSPVALPYTAVAMPDICIDFLKFLRNQKCELFIGNRSIPHSIIHLLFGDPKIIGSPSRSAYKEINRIEQECLKAMSEESDDYRLVIVSCGNTGRVLIKRLWPKFNNVFFFDMGSLMDALCGWKTRGWIRKTKFNSKKFRYQLVKSLNK